jgi:hypothetical protein
MLYREIIAVCSEIHTKHINTLCGQNVELLNVKPGGTYSNRWAWQGYVNHELCIQSHCSYGLILEPEGATKAVSGQGGIK